MIYRAKTSTILLDVAPFYLYFSRLTNLKLIAYLRISVFIPSPSLCWLISMVADLRLVFSFFFLKFLRPVLLPSHSQCKLQKAKYDKSRTTIQYIQYVVLLHNICRVFVFCFVCLFAAKIWRLKQSLCRVFALPMCKNNNNKNAIKRKLGKYEICEDMTNEILKCYVSCFCPFVIISLFRFENAKLWNNKGIPTKVCRIFVLSLCGVVFFLI
jgi:hypothetical protein